jgi:hypothetical protein
MPKAYTSPAGLSLPNRSSSGGLQQQQQQVTANRYQPDDDKQWTAHTIANVAQIAWCNAALFSRVNHSPVKADTNRREHNWTLPTAAIMMLLPYARLLTCGSWYPWCVLTCATGQLAAPCSSSSSTQRGDRCCMRSVQDLQQSTAWDAQHRAQRLAWNTAVQQHDSAKHSTALSMQNSWTAYPGKLPACPSHLLRPKSDT